MALKFSHLHFFSFTTYYYHVFFTSLPRLLPVNPTKECTPKGLGLVWGYFSLFIIVSPPLNQCLAHRSFLINTCCINKYLNNSLNRFIWIKISCPLICLFYSLTWFFKKIAVWQCHALNLEWCWKYQARVYWDSVCCYHHFRRLPCADTYNSFSWKIAKNYWEPPECRMSLIPSKEISLS